MPFPDFLKLAAAASVITVIGSLIALYLKEVLTFRWAERWKAQRALDEAMRKYRDPISLAAVELMHRLCEIISRERTLHAALENARRDQSPAARELLSGERKAHFLGADVLKESPENFGKNDDQDPYYRNYKFASTVYRFCALLGWLELYRQEVTFLDSQDRSRNEGLNSALGMLRAALADGHLILTHEDWRNRRDALLFREELRAIGEAMLSVNEGQRVVIGYGGFVARWRAQSDPWISCARNFFIDLGLTETDFRSERCRHLLLALVRLHAATSDRPLSKRIAREISSVRRDLGLSEERPS